MPSDPIHEEFHQWHVPYELWQKLKPLAREMRQAPTGTEYLLWQKLRNKQLMGFKFRRQHAIGRFIVDFYCHEAKLIVEVDGLIHEQNQENDRIRQEFLEFLGFRVLRFQSEEIVQNMPGVLQEILTILESLNLDKLEDV